MKFTAIGRTLCDETTPYLVTDYKAKTVVELVNEVLERRREWRHDAVQGACGRCRIRLLRPYMRVIDGDHAGEIQLGFLH